MTEADLTRTKVLGRIAKNRLEEVRVCFCLYKGLSLIDIRIYSRRAEDGEWAPSHKGVSIDSGSARQLLTAVTAAVSEAIGWGDLKPGPVPAPAPVPVPRGRRF